jgi:hypothetical protein
MTLPENLPERVLRQPGATLPDKGVALRAGHAADSAASMVIIKYLTLLSLPFLFSS